MSWVAIGVGVAGAAAGAISSKSAQNKAGDAARAAGKQDIGGDINSYVNGYSQALPGIMGTEGKYRPGFQQLNLGDISSFLQGGGGQMGLFGLGSKATKAAGLQLATAKKNELNQMTNQTGKVRSLFQSLSPESARMVAQSQQQALAAQKAAGGLTGQEARSAQQFAREGSADRGRLMDNSAMASEVLNRDSILGQKRQEANMATQNAFGMANQFYSQPGMQSLNQIPQAYQAGQGYLGMGAASIGQGTPQLINPDAALNLGAANRQNNLTAASSAAQMSATNNAAMMNSMGNMFSSYMQYRGTQK